MRSQGILVALAAVVLAGCGIGEVFGPSGGPYPGACADLGFAPRQCAAMVGRVATWSGGKMIDADTIDVLPPTSGSHGLGGYMISRVRSHPATGPAQTVEIWCLGIGGGGDEACDPDPMIGISGGVDHDVPCAGEPPDGCATLPPSARPASVAEASPLRIASLDIPIDHVGHYEIEVGDAGLPDGVLSERSATIADPRPTAFWIEHVISLDVRPVDRSRPPIGSIYRTPFDGVEPVKVFLVFDATEITPGGVLQVRDLVVR